MKRRLISLLLVVVFCAGLCVFASAEGLSIGVSLSASAAQTGTGTQDIVMTVEASQTVSAAGIQLTIDVPAGAALKSVLVNGISVAAADAVDNEVSDGTDGAGTLTLNTATNTVVWSCANAENVAFDAALAQVTFTVPLSAAADFTFGAENILVGYYENYAAKSLINQAAAVTATFSVTEPVGFAVTVNDLTNGNATISGLTSGESYNGGTTFNVVCSKACIILFSADGGATYTRLAATANAEAGYDFTADVTGEAVITVVIKGDINMDGSMNTSDATLINRSLLSTTNSRAYALTALQSVIADVDGGGSINASDRTAITRSILATTHSRYAALAW